MFFTKIFKLPQMIWLNSKLKINGVTFGQKIRGNRILIKNTGTIKLGNGVYLNSYPAGELYITGLLTHCEDSLISIGDNCKLNGTIIHCRSSVSIASDCLFGPGTRIVDNDSHRISIDKEERRKPPNSAPIKIEENVWVGMNSLILKGVTIGKNSIVAAYSVVTKDVPENVLVAGNPAKVKKTLT